MHYINPHAVCQVDTDLVFVLDESGSIGNASFQEVKTFVRDFVHQLTSQSQSGDMIMNRVGIIPFSSSAREYIALNSSIVGNELLTQIAELRYNGGGTNTAHGLELMREQAWRDEISILRLAIVLTDGQSNDRPATLLAAQAVHDYDPPITVYAIGVGDNVDEAELETIASEHELYSHLDAFDPSLFDSTRESYSYQICFTSEQCIQLSSN